MGHIGVALLNDPTNIAKAKESFTDTETKNNLHQNFSSQKWCENVKKYVHLSYY